MSRMRLRATLSVSMLVLIRLLTGCQCQAGEEAPQNQFWIFLVAGKPATGVAKEEIQKKQQAHLDNFKRLANAKLLLAAGPLADPNKKLRGIVVVVADDEQQLPEHFRSDPYVDEGFMKLESNRIVEQEGDLVVQFDATELDELRIVVWDRKPLSEAAAAALPTVTAAHRDYWKKMRDDGKVAVRARFSENVAHFGVAILRKAPDEEIKQWLDSDPLVQQNTVTYQVMPQYLLKGSVKFQP